MKFCQKCGTQLSDDAVFCSSCGNRIPMNQSFNILETSGKNKGKRKNAVIAITMAALILLALVVGAVVIFSGKNDKQEESFEGELTEEKARELYLKCMEHMVSDE